MNFPGYRTDGEDGQSVGKKKKKKNLEWPTVIKWGKFNSTVRKEL